jgi:hypothetical protein
MTLMADRIGWVDTSSQRPEPDEWDADTLPDFSRARLDAEVSDDSLLDTLFLD